MHHLWGYRTTWRKGRPRCAALALLWACTFTVHATEIGLQFLVGRATAGQTGPAEIERMVDELNATFARSRVALVAHISHVATLDFPSTDARELLEAMHAGRGPFARLHADADAYGADFTIALEDDLLLRGKANCGRAYAVNRTRAELADPRRALAAMRPRCGSHTLAHELGHLMGLNHGAQVDRCAPGRGHTHAITAYANGHAVGNCDGQPQAGEFGTVMVGGWMRVINGERVNRLEVYSNPLLLHDACGTTRRCGDPATGDAARALNAHATLYAGHAERDADRLAYADPALARCIARDHRGGEIAELERLACNDPDLVSLEGVAQLVALREIDLAGSAVASLAPLHALSLRRVVLSGIDGLPCAELTALRTATPDATLVVPEKCQP